MTALSTTLKIENNLACLTLNRPEKHNAFDDQVISELLDHLDTIKRDQSARALLLRAEGKHFCAGADLSWMKRMADLTYEENLEDARQLATLMRVLHQMPIPTIVGIQGAAYGGAIGLIACCDIAIASENSKFCLSEVKLGLAPATIGPYVVKAMGARRCRQLFATAEVFDAEQAEHYGLVHTVATKDELDGRIDTTVSKILDAGPMAEKAAKHLINLIETGSENLFEQTSEMIAELRVSPEGQEGLSAFFDKRKPNWQH